MSSNNIRTHFRIPDKSVQLHNIIFDDEKCIRPNKQNIFESKIVKL